MNVTRDDLVTRIAKVIASFQDQDDLDQRECASMVVEFMWPAIEALRRIDLGEAPVVGLQPHFYGHAMMIARSALRTLDGWLALTQPPPSQS